VPRQRSDSADRQPPGAHTTPRFFDLLRVLCDRQVDFVLIGGFAVALHGYVRATKDIDIVPEPSRENLTRLWGALTELEATPAELEDFRPEELPVTFSLEGLLEGGNWALYTRLGRIDVMQWVKGIGAYDELRRDAEQVDEPSIGHPIRFAGLDDLISMKEAAGRDIDRIDITALRMAQELEE
jgi:hypothetical protein